MYLCSCCIPLSFLDSILFKEFKRRENRKSIEQYITKIVKHVTEKAYKINNSEHDTTACFFLFGLRKTLIKYLFFNFQT